MARTFKGPFLMTVLCVSGAAVSAEKWFEVPGGSWSPRQSNLVAIEQGLHKHIMLKAGARHLQVKPWHMYKFQYQGQGNAKRQAIFINAFCTDFGYKELPRKWLIAIDGGTCFFRVKYVPVKGTFDGLEFNGEA